MLDGVFSTPCPCCKKPQRVYRKKYYHDDGTTVSAHPKFYVCANDECREKLNIQTHEKIHTVDEVFEWVLVYDGQHRIF